MTVLRGLSELSRTGTTSKPSFCRRCVATEIELPTTLGTCTRAGVKHRHEQEDQPDSASAPSSSHGQRLRGGAAAAAAARSTTTGAGGGGWAG